MPLNQSLIAEYKAEMAKTRKILQLVPMDKLDWNPHKKSMKIGRLAQHLAEMPSWIEYTINYPELDFSKPNTPTPQPKSNEELLKMMDNNLAKGLTILENTSDEKFHERWTMRNGETIFFTLPKIEVLRSFVFNHNVHHRAQLGVYLRLLNIPIPGSYGPSADEGNM